MRLTYSASGLVLNKRGEVLVVNQNGNSWSLPKGHIDKGETPRQAAEREIEEESGITRLEYIKELGSYARYRIGKDGIGENKNELKHIVVFLYKTGQTELKPLDPHNPEAKWAKAERIGMLLTHPKDKEFYESVRSDLKEFIA